MEGEGEEHVDDLGPTPEEIEAEKQAAEEEKQRLNRERVQFIQPVVKYIVSPHSGSILSEDGPVVELTESLREKCMKVFDEVASRDDPEPVDADGKEENSPPEPLTVKKENLSELLLQCGFNHDLELLNKIIDEFYSGPEKLELDSFLQFVEKFQAPDYQYGERLRRNVGRGQNVEVEKLLVRNCDPNTSDGEGTSSLHYCCEFNRPDVMQIIADIAQNKLVLNAKDRYGWTPLHTSVHHGTKNCTALLIKLGADPNAVNNMGKSPLHLAAMQNRGAILDLLLTAGGDLNLQDGQGMTPLHEATYRGQFTLYNEISKNPLANLDLKDKLGNTPGDYFVEEFT